MGSKNSSKIQTIMSQVLGPIKRSFKASNQPKHYKKLKQSITSSRIKPLPHGVCQKLPKPMPMCSPRCVEPLCFLVRRNPTVRSLVNLERRCSLSKKITKCLATASPPCLHVFFFFFFFSSFSLIFPFLPLRTVFFLFVFLFAFHSFPFLISFSHHFFFSFLFLFLFVFLLSLYTFSSPFWSIDCMGQKEKVSSPLPQAKCVAIPFLFLFFNFIIPLYDIITYMAQCEPWNSCHPCGSM